MAPYRSVEHPHNADILGISCHVNTENVVSVPLVHITWVPFDQLSLANSWMCKETDGVGSLPAEGGEKAPLERLQHISTWCPADKEGRQTPEAISPGFFTTRDWVPVVATGAVHVEGGAAASVVFTNCI